MTVFRYRARDGEGRALAGEIEAVSAGEAAARLAAGGMTPVGITSHDPAISRDIQIFRPRVRTEELVMLCRQLHTLLRAGVPLIRTLSGLAETSRNPELRDSLAEVVEGLKAGRDLGTALEARPRVFSGMFVNTVRMGESTGRLEETFAELARHIERDQETQKRVKSAARYPTFVIAAVGAALGVINVFVIPAFSEVFAQYGSDLPLPTRILLGTSNFFRDYWLLLLAIAGIAVWSFRSWRATESGGLRWDEMRLRMPLVGPIVKRATLARFARGFALADRSGIPVIAGLRTVAAALHNHFVESRVEHMCERISGGGSLEAAATSSGLFTPLVLQMLAVGEESGSVSELLDEVADYYEREVDYDLKHLSDLIEPVLIGSLGLVVLVLALGVYLPLWDLATVAKG